MHVSRLITLLCSAVLVTDQCSGPGRAVSQGYVCLSVCIQIVTFQVNNLSLRHLTCWLNLIMSVLNVMVEVIG